MKNAKTLFLMLLILVSFSFARSIRLAKDLDLSENQIEQVNTYRESKKDEQKQFWEDIKNKKASIKRELDKTNSNRGKINKLVDEINLIQRKQIQNWIDATFEMKKILNTEQYTKWRKLSNNRRDKIKGRIKKWRGERKKRKGMPGEGTLHHEM